MGEKPGQVGETAQVGEKPGPPGAGVAHRRSRPTLREVAEAAGVSLMTASYVYSQPDRVAPATAAKVRAAAERLDYPGPHPGARSLRRGRAGSLGVVLASG